jgi:hypothetical protein
MELLRGTAPTVAFYHPTSDTEGVTAEYSVDGGSGVSAPVTTNGEKSSIRLPYLQAQNTIEVIWSFEIDGHPYSETYSYEVASPYLSIREVREIIGDDATDDEVLQAEAAARHIINAHTGQSFGFTHKTLTVEGHGERALRLPERLVVLEGLSTLSATLNPRTAIIVSDGWYLKKGWSENVTAIPNDNLYFTGDDISDVLPGEPGYEKTGHGEIIVAPGSTQPSQWRDDYPFTIIGWWGYEHVPTPVREATRLLINDYACGESAYRDRYLNAIKAADWRLDFNARTWEATGNVRADQLLAEYVLLNWAVV